MTVKELRSLAVSGEEHKAIDNFLRDAMDTVMGMALGDLVDISGDKSTYRIHHDK